MWHCLKAVRRVFHSIIGYQAGVRGTKVAQASHWKTIKGLIVAALPSGARHESPFIAFHSSATSPPSLPSKVAPQQPFTGAKAAAAGNAWNTVKNAVGHHCHEPPPVSSQLAQTRNSEFRT